MRIRYVALTLAAGLAASAAALSPGAARAADYSDGYSAYHERDYDEPERYERRARVVEDYDEPVVEERVVRRRYVEAPTVYVAPRYYGPGRRFYGPGPRFYGPRWGYRHAYYGPRRGYRGRW